MVTRCADAESRPEIQSLEFDCLLLFLRSTCLLVKSMPHDAAFFCTALHGSPSGGSYSSLDMPPTVLVITHCAVHSLGLSMHNISDNYCVLIIQNNSLSNRAMQINMILKLGFISKIATMRSRLTISS